ALSIAPPAGSTPETGKINGLSQGEIDYVTNDVNAVDVKTGTGIDTFTVLGTPNLNFNKPLTTINPGGGANFITVQGTSANGPLKIIDGPFDVVKIGNNGSVQAIQGDVPLAGPGTPIGTGLFIDDSQDMMGHTVTLASGKITGLTPVSATINFDPATI